jgi:uncharacterized protein YdhG (YjbR/CyaY superfamily)
MAATKSSTYEGFSAEEKAAMKERAQEMKKTARRATPADKAAEAEQDVLAKIAALTGTDKVLAEGLHAIVKKHAPTLTSKTYYGMPGYALDGKLVCFFKPASKFKARYATFEFNDPAKLDDGPMWATAFALTDMTPDVEKRIVDLIKKAVS